MSRKITPAQVKAVGRYESANYDKVLIRMPKDGTRERAKARAESMGESLNSYMLRLIQQDMEKASE